jgi:hypothetical protein
MSSIPPLSEDVRRLIASDVAHAATPETERTKVLRELEVTLGLALAPSAALLAKAPGSPVIGSKLGLGLAAKIALIAGLSGSVITGGWLLRPARQASVAAAPRTSRSPVVSVALVAPTSTAASLEASALPSASSSAPLKTAARVTSTDNLAEERRLLAAARSSLQQHDLSHATALLAEHTRRFGAGSLGEERDRLLVQAAVLSGDVARARNQAQTFVKRYPKSVYTPGVTRLLDTLK